VFQVSGLSAASGSSYLVYAVTKDGVPTVTVARVSLSMDPQFTLDKSSVDLNKDLPATVTMAGSHLDKLSSVCLSSGLAASGVQLPLDGGNSPTQRTFVIDAQSKPVPGLMHVFIGDCGGSPTDSKVTINLTSSKP
jgi:hypothetical protein